MRNSTDQKISLYYFGFTQFFVVDRVNCNKKKF